MQMKRFFAGKSSRLVLAVSLAGLTAFAGCAAFVGKGTADKTPEQWQSVARADLDAVHGAMIAAHPGYIDDANPGPRTRAEQGYLEAQALIPRVESYDTMMSAVRYYVAGFRDGHLVYSDNARSLNYRERVTGWRVDRQAACA